jgi:hypothetical protein
MRRRKLLVALAGLTVVLAARVVVLWPPKNRITEENFKRIHRGMTRTQVEEILGQPGDYTTGPVKLPGDSDTIDSLEPEVVIALASRRLWISDSAGVEITFDDQDRVGRVEPAGLVPAPRSNADRFIWRLKGQWHRWFPE